MITMKQIEEAFKHLSQEIESLRQMGEKRERRIEILEGKLAEFLNEYPTESAIGSSSSLGLKTQGLRGQFPYDNT